MSARHRGDGADPFDELESPGDVQSGAYALHALGDTERDEYERRLEHDADERTEVAGLLDTAVLLGSDLPEQEPPAGLRARLLAQIAETPQDRVDGAAAEAPDAGRPVVPIALASGLDLTNRIGLGPIVPSGAMRVDGPAEADRRDDDRAGTPWELAEGDDVGPAERRARRHWGRRAVVGVAAVAAAIGLIVGSVSIGQQFVRPQSADEAIYAQVVDAEDSVAQTANIGVDGTLTVISSASEGRSVALWQGEFEPLETGYVYELWYIGDEARPAGLIDVASLPDNGAYVVLDGRIDDASSVGVTIEPEGGSAQPTSDVLAAVDL